MKVTIADQLPEQTITALTSLGVEVDFRPELTTDDLTSALENTVILVVRSTRVTAAVLEAAPELSLVIRAGAGVNTIDLECASARGIFVANCPGKNAVAVAELAIGLLVAADRSLVDATLSLREGRWQKKKFGKAAGLKGRTLGIVGFGTIGREVARRAIALEMQILVWSRSMNQDVANKHGVRHAQSLQELFSESDAVSVHLPSTPATRHLVDAKLFGALKQGAIFINTSRGELVDTVALRTAILDKNLRVGLDVFEEEPSGSDASFSDTELVSLVTGTPHIGASTAQASEAVAEEVVRIIQVFLETGRPSGTVNLCARSPATHQLVVRHYNRVGVLAGVLDALRSEGINVEEMDNTIFEGVAAACCTLQLDQCPSPEILKTVEADENTLHVTLTRHEVA